MTGGTGNSKPMKPDLSGVFPKEHPLHNNSFLWTRVEDMGLSVRATNALRVNNSINWGFELLAATHQKKNVAALESLVGFGKTLSSEVAKTLYSGYKIPVEFWSNAAEISRIRQELQPLVKIMSYLKDRLPDDPEPVALIARHFGVDLTVQSMQAERDGNSGSVLDVLVSAVRQNPEAGAAMREGFAAMTEGKKNSNVVDVVEKEGGGFDVTATVNFPDKYRGRLTLAFMKNAIELTTPTVLEGIDGDVTDALAVYAKRLGEADDAGTGLDKSVLPPVDPAYSVELQFSLSAKKTAGLTAQFIREALSTPAFYQDLKEEIGAAVAAVMGGCWPSDGSKSDLDM